MANISQVQLPSGVSYPIKAPVIPYGMVDSTSTATVFTATVPGITELTDGTIMMLHNGVVTSASGFTVNINGLGAKKCYNNMTNATQDTTIFNVAYTMVFVYASSLDGGNGGWWIYRGYDGNTNTIGYQLRTNSGNKVATDTGYRYRLWFTSADGEKWVPANTSTSTNATSNRTLNTRKIDPFGPIVYRATNGTCNSGAGIGATGIWQQYTLTIGYSYMQTGFSLTFPAPVYVQCTPQTDGSATMNSIVQALPTTKDGKIYIYLGTAYSATNMELEMVHPVYYHDGNGIKLWTGSTIPSVSAVANLSSGTQVGTVTVDGTTTTFYAPTAGGGGTVESVTVANATNGGLSVSGSPITTSGTITIGHSNVLTSAQTTQAVYPIKIDKNGHISDYGTAVTIPTKTSDLVNDSGFITSVSMTDTEVDAAVEDAFITRYTITNNCPTYASIDKAQAAANETVTITLLQTFTGTMTISGMTTSFSGSGWTVGTSKTFAMPFKNVTVSIVGGKD